MTSTQDGDTVGQALAQARRHVQHASGELERRIRDPRTAHTTVAEMHHLVDALAGLVNALMERLPAAASTTADRTNAADEVVMDLRAMHGCLTTGLLLVEPALQDLRGLSQPGLATASGGEDMTRDIPDADRADQEHVVEPAEDRPEDDAPTATTETTTGDAATDANPADRAEQQQTAPQHDPFQI